MEDIKDAAAKMQFGTRQPKKHGLKPNAWTAAECEAVRTHYLNGGATEVLGLRDGGEVAQVTQLHGSSSRVPVCSRGW